VAISQANQDVGHVMQVMGVVPLFPVFATPEDAVEFMEQDNPPPTGAVFRETPDGRGPPPPMPPEGSSAILVLPDQDLFSSIVRLRLLASHSSCAVFHDCKTAMEHIRVDRPNVVLLEERIDGSEAFVRELKTKSADPELAVVKLYPNNAPVGGKEALSVREDDFVIQPFEMMELFLMAERQSREVPEARRSGSRRLHFDFESSREQQRQAVGFFEALVSWLGYEGDDMVSFRAAFREAVDNAVCHGNRYNEALRVDVFCVASRDSLSVRVTDQGEGFDFEQPLEKARSATQEEVEKMQADGERLGGLGMTLMARCVDSVRYEEGGTTVILEKKMRTKSEAPQPAS
jgi:anti-sigma regulatory factor (Ser/Thr protein kinase)